MWKSERELKEGWVKRADVAEKRFTEATQEVTTHRSKTVTFEDEVRMLRRRIYGLE